MKLNKLLTFRELYNNKNIAELEELSQNIRDFLINFVNLNNGHIGSNLGVVELTIAIFAQFDLKNTILLFDTGHQSHVYKLLVNGIKKFKSLKKYNGLSNFQEINESNFDWISTGHSSTSLGYAFGYALANNMKNIVSIIGDAAFLTGYVHSGLLNLNNVNKKTITILNDNREAIGENALFLKDSKKYIESLGFEYFLCENGHDFKKLFFAIKIAKKAKKHIVIHCLTQKALGYNGERSLVFNHSIENNIENSYSKLIAEYIETKFSKNDFLVCPAMLNSSNFNNLKQKFKNNVIDVGINEEFAILTACAIANSKKKVFISIYSTFLQRIFDQLVHDVFRNNLPMTFLIDRGGLNYGGGISHHGIFDISLINNFKKAIIAQPYSYSDLKRLIDLAYFTNDKQFFIRYENEKTIMNDNKNEFEIGEWEELKYNINNKVTLISYGSILEDFLNYFQENNLKINLINARFINPIDKTMLEKHKENKLFVYEQVIDKNNLFTNIKEYLYNKNDIFSFSFSETNIHHGDKKNILKALKMDIESIVNQIEYEE
ncbi:1-deoxy-D-xylulose-5-phosphate synthase N-terminal domain-containing protein [Spiroplasma taiwanense]|uniref:1-deoxy-D-xylulose-5-phosphate synthase n=1 Tax=Spiroplasma taiwanense CT-1 TaxID=1276220 RepID=S5MBV0_9MOLU|nr:1-deoxy-D-xylulose-5-phosphate synthase N-terminal domain-containing protein [Spiroplasma taiwanense]AGR41223.1 1-deoxy-D-xylulose-5-phosphate synthase [Spiroplasma taiwanense CT-1]